MSQSKTYEEGYRDGYRDAANDAELKRYPKKPGTVQYPNTHPIVPGLSGEPWKYVEKFGCPSKTNVTC